MESIEGEISSLAIRLGEPRECEQRSTSNWTVAITSIHEKGIARVLVRTIIESLVLTVCNKSEFIHRCHNIAGLNISIFYFLFFIFLNNGKRSFGISHEFLPSILSLGNLSTEHVQTRDSPPARQLVRFMVIVAWWPALNSYFHYGLNAESCMEIDSRVYIAWHLNGLTCWKVCLSSQCSSLELNLMMCIVLCVIGHNSCLKLCVSIINF